MTAVYAFKSAMGGKLIHGVRISPAALVCLALIAASCGGKHASAPPDALEGEAVAKAMPVAGPVLKGEYVAWGAGGIDDESIEPLRLMVGSPGAKPRVVWEQHPSRGKPEWWFIEIEGSPKAVTFVRGWSNCEPAPYDQCGAESEIGVAALDEDVKSLPRHDTECGFSPGSHHVDVDRGQVVFSGPYCVPQCAPPYCRPQCGPCSRIAIDDVADRKPPRTLVHKSDGRDEVRIAGNFIAARSGRRAAVYDVRSGVLVYRARLPNDSSRIDLQADGKMVAVSWLSGRTGAAWFSPDEPWEHAVRIRPVLIHSYEEHAVRTVVRLADDRVAFERQITPEESELVVADLDGEAMQHVASFDQKRARIGGFDFDGKRVTWAMQEVERVTKECWRISEAGHMACQKIYKGPTTIYLARLG